MVDGEHGIDSVYKKVQSISMNPLCNIFRRVTISGSGLIVIVVHRLFGFVQRGLAGDSTFYKGAYQKVVSHETKGFPYILRRN